MPKLFRFSLLLILSLAGGRAQAQADLSARVLTQQDEPLSFANLLLLNPTDSALITGNVTDVDGLAVLSGIEPGDYIVNVSMLGYQSHYAPLTVRGTTAIKLGDIRLSEAATLLDAVEVRERRPLFEQRMDRLVVNVQNSITSSGGTVLDVLERSPGVQVNRQFGGISLSGKGGVIVMINGKISRLPISDLVQMLSGMSAANVEKIELITTPPSDFDAEGDAGIINIVLKKDDSHGLNGSASVTSGYGRREKAGTGVNFNYRKGDLNLYGDYAFLHSRQRQEFDFFRQLDRPEGLLITDTRTYRRPTQRNHNGRLGLDYTLNEKTVVGALVSGYDNRWSMTSRNNTLLLTEDVLNSRINLDLGEINHWSHLMGNVNVQHRPRPNQLLSFDVDYLYYFDDNPSTYLYNHFDPAGQPTGTEQWRISKETPIHFWVGKADYSFQPFEKAEFKLGLKSTRSTFANDVELQELVDDDWRIVPDFTTLADLEESIYAGYSQLQWGMTDRLNLNLGLRFERTNTLLETADEGAVIDRNYANLFPSMSVSYKLNEQQILQGAFSRRITRPTFSDMAPFVIFMDPTTFFSGNAALQPALSNTFKVDYRFKTILLGLQYNRETDAIARFQAEVDPETNRQMIRAENLDRRRTLSATLSFPVQPARWWRMQYNLTALRQIVQHQRPEQALDFRKNTLQLNGSSTFTLPAGFSLELSGYYQSGSLWGFFGLEPFGALNLGVQKEFADKSKLSLSVSDLFRSSYWTIPYDMPQLYLTGEANIKFEMRVVRLTYSRTFGNSSVTGTRKRETGSEEERKRVN